MIAVSTHEEAVSNGIALLDQHAPGWREKIGTEPFVDIQDSHNCVLARVYAGSALGRFGSFTYGVYRLGLLKHPGEAVAFGFAATDGKGLAAEWNRRLGLGGSK